MPLPKPLKSLKIAVLLPCYKRAEYTKKCIDALVKAQEYPNTNFYLIDDGSNDETFRVLENNSLPKTVVSSPFNEGLRASIINFFDYCKRTGVDILAKMDNDCIVPKNWLNDIIDVFNNTEADILSPNVYPSNAAFQYGSADNGEGYRPAEIVGGLWIMKREMIEDMYFEQHQIQGLVGAISILKQIVVEKEPKVGWVAEVTVQDIGHWSGRHPDHIKSKEHETYSKEVGRQIAWKA